MFRAILPSCAAPGDLAVWGVAMFDDMQSVLMTALRAAEAAGREILDVYRGPVDVRLKDDRSPLTEADLRAHHAILSVLNRAFPEVPVLSEESAAIPYDKRASWTAYWLVDPLDGTKEFIKHNDEFTVNIAFLSGKEPAAGVVLAPALGRSYLGAAGVGAFRLDWTPAEPLPSEWPDVTARAVALPHDATSRPFTVVASRSHRSPDTESFIDDLRQSHPNLELISAGSALKLCLVAEGAADLYPRFAPTMEWDTAAGHAVCAACGVSVRTHPEDEPLAYNKPDLRNPWFLADGRGRHE